MYLLPYISHVKDEDESHITAHTHFLIESSTIKKFNELFHRVDDEPRKNKLDILQVLVISDNYLL